MDTRRSAIRPDSTRLPGINFITTSKVRIFLRVDIFVAGRCSLVARPRPPDHCARTRCISHGPAGDLWLFRIRMLRVHLRRIMCPMRPQSSQNRSRCMSELGTSENGRCLTRRAHNSPNRTESYVPSTAGNGEKQGEREKAPGSR